MKFVAVFFVSLGMLSACDFAAGPHIYVHGAAQSGPTTAATIVTGITSSEVTAILAVVERIALAHGFHSDPRFHEPELLVAYVGEFRPDGSTPLCFVYRRAQLGIVEVWLHEWGRFHPSDVVAATDAELFSALQARFGGARVTRREKT
jgi:hypothetical protein